ncbi:MAG: hypothetical protein A2V64_03330 [Bacteroidetes bacterium RBG_13_43_22]|nr:MAG: hypothetical protein A2V64_03330 [Bacteroidetes bacterium RBG_13_43_22]
MRYSLLILFSLLFYTEAAGQKDTLIQKNDTVPNRFYLLQKVKRNGETLPEVEIKEVAVVGRMQGSPRREQSQFRKYQRLVYNLKKVYPYAMVVRERLSDVNAELATISDEKDRRNYLKQFEKEVFNEYEDDIRDMTITQGKLLLKLIYRETYNTSYDLIREYRGGLNAAFWQGIARIFGTNLKSEYDPYGEDILVELIIQDIQSGLL